MRNRVRSRFIAFAILLLLIIVSLGTGGARATQQYSPVTKSTQTGTPDVTEAATSDSGDVSIDSGDATATPGSARPTATKTKPGKATAVATADLLTDGGPLADGDTKSGTIDDAHFLYSYTYEGKQDEQITLTITPKQGLNLLLTVLPPDGVLFSDSQPFESVTATSGKAAKLSFAIPADGRYLVTLLSSDTTQGTFTLAFALGSGDTSGNGGGDTGGNGSAVNTINISGTSVDVVAGLQKAGLVPKGGKQLLSLPSGNVKDSSAPGGYFTIAPGTTAQNMVINFQVSWAAAGTQSACGMYFRLPNTNDPTTGSLVYLTNDNYVALLQFDNRKPIISYDKPSKLFSPKDTNTVTILALDDKLSLYVNGKLETAQTGKTAKGAFAWTVYNAKGNKVITDCRYKNIWVWSFDGK